MAVRVLVYLEPCIFRDDPTLLRCHFELFVSPVLRALSLDSELGFLAIASNVFLSLEGLNTARSLPENPHDIKLYPLYNIDLLAQSNYCIEDYAWDVFRTDEWTFRNSNLLGRLGSILANSRPDIVITTTQNRYLRYLSRTMSIPLLSMEFGPLPRLPYPMNRFVSTDGHLSEGAFSSPTRLHIALKGITDDGKCQSLQVFKAKYLQAVETHPQYETVRKLIDRIKGTGTVSMLALQPEEYVSWEGVLGKRRSGLSIIYESLATMRSDKLIVTFHADKRGNINPVSMREVWLSDPRLELLPDELSSGLSELFLPCVDELVTVSSNVAMAAFLLGKPVRAIGESFVRTLEQLQIGRDEGTDWILRDRIFRYLTEVIGVDNATFSDPGLLRKRLSRMLIGQSKTVTGLSEAEPLRDAKSAADWITQPRRHDLRASDLTTIHAHISNSQPGLQNCAWLLSDFGRHALGYMLSDGSVGAEFGVARGYFSESLLRSGRFSRLYSIDKWDDHHDDAEFTGVRDRLAQFGERSQILRMSFEEALAVIPPQSLDFVYVDGYAHTGHDADVVRQCLAKLKPGGLVAVHDYDPFSWPINHDRLAALFYSGIFSQLQHIPAVLTQNDEDIFPGLVARYSGG
jgi:hypothetical protein